MHLRKTLPVLALSSVMSLSGVSMSGCLFVETSGNSKNDSHTHESEVIDASVTWKDVHTVKNYVTVENATLTLAAGSTIKMGRGAYITIGQNGRIVAEGARGSEVIFTSASDLPEAGDWNGIKFDDNADSGSKFEFTRFEYATDAVVMSKSTAAIKDCTFTAPLSAGVVLGSDAAPASFSNNFFTDISSYNGNAYAIKAHPNALVFLDSIMVADNSLGATIFVESGSTSRKGTWRYQPIPYELEGYITVENVINIEAGNTFYMPMASYITVAADGAFNCNGTSDKGGEIIFTSKSAAPEAGDWLGISFDWNAQAGSKISYTRFEFATNAIVIKESGASIDNCTFVSPKESGVVLEEKAKVPSFTNNTFTKMKSANAVLAHPEAMALLGRINVDAGSPTTQILVDSGTVTKSATWVAQPTPVVIDSYFNVDDNAVLDIEVGEVRLNFQGYIDVLRAALNIYDTKFTYAVSGKQWKAITYTSTSEESVIENSEILYGGSGDNGALVVKDHAHVTLDNVRFSDNKDCDYTLENNGQIDFKNMLPPEEC